jgi:hypothetical protein
MQFRVTDGLAFAGDVLLERRARSAYGVRRVVSSDRKEPGVRGRNPLEKEARQ